MNNIHIKKPANAICAVIALFFKKRAGKKQFAKIWQRLKLGKYARILKSSTLFILLAEKIMKLILKTLNEYSVYAVFLGSDLEQGGL